MIDARAVGGQLEAMEGLDTVVAPVHTMVAKLLPSGPFKDVLHGVWLGHPLHPVLTDLPIGFWTAAFVLDLTGGRRSRRAADTMVGLGVVTALPTAAAGLADWSELLRPEQRSGAVHAAANLMATGLYGWSLVERRRGRRAAGVMLGLAGATAATVGAFLGGHLSYRRGIGVNQTARVSTDTSWVDITVEGSIDSQAPTTVQLDGQLLAAVEVDGEAVALLDRCSHLGGPLHEGELVDGCLRCPWHGSMFRADSGVVVRGPATSPQPAWELAGNGPQRRARRRPAPQ